MCVCVYSSVLSFRSVVVVSPFGDFISVPILLYI